MNAKAFLHMEWVNEVSPWVLKEGLKEVNLSVEGEWNDIANRLVQQFRHRMPYSFRLRQGRKRWWVKSKSFQLDALWDESHLGTQGANESVDYVTVLPTVMRCLIVVPPPDQQLHMLVIV
jgi:hypothetical protein